MLLWVSHVDDVATRQHETDNNRLATQEFHMQRAPTTGGYAHWPMLEHTTSRNMGRPGYTAGVIFRN